MQPGAAAVVDVKINSSRMYEALSKLREYQFRLTMYSKSKS